MKREIKFRGKRADGSSWVYGDLRQENSGNKVIMTNLSTWGDNGDNVDPYGEDVIVNPDTIGQFTGLKDKNGKEIYEGDILMCIGQRADNKGRKYYRKVVFDNGSFCMTVPEYKMLSPLRDHIVDGKLGWEVIGNIYDNPELIKKED